MIPEADPPSVHIDDAALLRAPRWLVHRRLADVDDWPTWWPGLRCLQGLPDGDGWLHLEVAVTRPWRPRRLLRLAVLPYGHRPDAGMRLLVGGDVRADVEFWLEDVGGGTLVHHLATVDGGGEAGVRWRLVVRRGLWALTDRLAAEVRQAVVVDPTRPPSVARGGGG